MGALSHLFDTFHLSWKIQHTLKLIFLKLFPFKKKSAPSDFFPQTIIALSQYSVKDTPRPSTFHENDPEKSLYLMASKSREDAQIISSSQIV